MAKGAYTWAVRALDAQGNELGRTEFPLGGDATTSMTADRFRAFVLESGGDFRRSAEAALEEQRLKGDEILLRMRDKLSGTEARELAWELYQANTLARQLQLLLHPPEA